MRLPHFYPIEFFFLSMAFAGFAIFGVLAYSAHQEDLKDKMPFSLRRTSLMEPGEPWGLYLQAALVGAALAVCISLHWLSGVAAGLIEAFK